MPPVNRSPGLQLVAHRGNAAEFPENTLPSLRSALELGVRFIEFDVHLSADGVPMIMHDANLLRCGGIDRDALSMSSAALAATAVGEATRFGGQFSQVRIPRLADIVPLLNDYPHAKAFVELKRASLQRFGMEVMVDAVLRVLERVSSQVIIISFDLPAVTRARQVGKVPMGWVLPEYSTNQAIKAEATLPDYLFCDSAKLPDNLLRLWRGPWDWACYEITTATQVDRLLPLGVRLLETMQVRCMQTLLADHLARPETIAVI